jgi:hypothetical protein
MAGCYSGLPNTSTVIGSSCDATSLSPSEFIDCTINSQQKYSNARSQDAQSASSSAVCSARGADLSIGRSEDKYDVTAIEPEIPDDIDNTIASYQNIQNIMLPLWKGTYDSYWANPRVAIYNPAYQAAASWMADVIVNGVTGIPTALEQQIINRATDRIRAEAATARNAAQDRSGVLGWDLPQPFAIAQGEAIELAAYREIGKASVDLAKEQFNIQDRNIRFAVEEANKIYLGMERNAVDYMRAWVGLLNNLKDMVEIDPNVRANYINATANLYGQRIKKDQIQWMSFNDYYQRLQGDNQLKSSNTIAQTDLVVKANTAAAEVQKMLAAATLSQLSTMVTKVATS